MTVYDIILKKVPVLLLLFVLVNAASCASGRVNEKSSKKNDGVKAVKIGDGNRYGELLVDIKSYSTNGGYYQKKYEKLLISMAKEIVEGQDLEITRESIGFYYDKTSARRDRLFFGLDINTVRESSLDYGRFSVKLIKENVSEIVDSMYKYNSILEEIEVVGIVIGFKWTENNNAKQVNIWMKKEDLQLFYERKITLNEMYQRSTITDSAGKIILLPI